MCLLCVRNRFFLLLAAALFAGSLRAQTSNDTAFEHDCCDTIILQRSPHKTLTTVAWAAGYAGATYLCYRFADDDVQRFAQRNQTKTLSFIARNYENIGLGGSSLIITGATAVTSLLTKNKKLQKTAILLAGGHVINDFVTNQFKITFQRHRPNTGDPYNTFDWRGGLKINKSFISSHTSNAFATATAFATVYKDSKWVPIAAYSAAALVGLCRIYNNAHWASDVLGGAAIGFASVKAMNGVYHLVAKKFTFLPQVSNSHYGVTIICFLAK